MIPIPVLVNEGPVWLLGIAWNADMMAAFLAWWMPLNLVSWLVFLAAFSLLDDGEWERRCSPSSGCWE